MTKEQITIPRWCHHHLPGAICVLVGCVGAIFRIFQIAIYFCVLTPAKFIEWYESI